MILQQQQYPNRNELNIPFNATLFIPLQKRCCSLRTKSGQSIKLDVSTSIRNSSQNNGEDDDTDTDTDIGFLLVGRRAATADIRCDHKSISRNHAALYYLPSSSSSNNSTVVETTSSSTCDIILQDLGGKHGCHVNDKRLAKNERRVVIHGDDIRFGNVRDQSFKVEILDDRMDRMNKMKEGEEEVEMNDVNDDSNNNNNTNHNNNNNNNNNANDNSHNSAIPPTTTITPHNTHNRPLIPTTKTITKQKNPFQGLTGRALREAEIAAATASLDIDPVYVTDCTTVVDDDNYDDNNNFSAMGLPSNFGGSNPNNNNNNNNNDTDSNVGGDERSSSMRRRNEHLNVPVSSSFSIPPPPSTVTSSSLSLSKASQNNRRSPSVVSITLDPSGSRLVIAHTDGSLRLYDLPSLDPIHPKPFRTVSIQEGHPLTASQFSPTGDRILCGTSSASPMLVDREGRELTDCARGDPYSVDVSRTVGHTASVTGVTWHPLLSQLSLTSSIDGSIRLWDWDNGGTVFGKMKCCYVYSIKSAKSKRTRVQCISFAPGGRFFAVGTCCGSLQIWKFVSISSSSSSSLSSSGSKRPLGIALEAGMDGEGGEGVVSISYSNDGRRIACRGGDGVVTVWDTKQLMTSGGSQKRNSAVAPYAICTDLKPCRNGSGSSGGNGGVAFSPDGNILCAGTAGTGKESGGKGRIVDSETKGNNGMGGRLKFYKLPPVVLTSTISTVVGDGVNGGLGLVNLPPLYVTDTLAKGGHVDVVMVEWHVKLNQIFIGLSDGSVQIFFDETLGSKGGAVIASSNAPRVRDSLSDLIKSRAPMGSSGVNPDKILAPHALPLFGGHVRKKRSRDDDPNEDDPRNKTKPDPPSSGIKMGEGTSASLNFTQFIVTSKSMAKNKNIAGKDPREELFKYSEGKSYLREKEGDKILAQRTAEEDEEEE